MGARGPTPKPTALHVLAGNPGHKTKAQLQRNEVKPRQVAPRCPTWLSLDARREWRRVAPLLERLGLLTELDGTALAGYCQAYAHWKQAELAIDEHGLTFTTESGYTSVRPEVAIAKQYLQIIKNWCAEFGLSPSARGRMTLPDVPEEPDGLELFLSGRLPS